MKTTTRHHPLERSSPAPTKHDVTLQSNVQNPTSVVFKSFHSLTIWELVGAIGFIQLFYFFFYMIIKQYLLCVLSMYTTCVCFYQLFRRNRRSFMFVLFSFMYLFAIDVMGYISLASYSTATGSVISIGDNLTQHQRGTTSLVDATASHTYASHVMLTHIIFLGIIIIHTALFIYNEYVHPSSTPFILKKPQFHKDILVWRFTGQFQVTFWEVFLFVLGAVFLCAVVHISMLDVVVGASLSLMFIIGISVYTFLKPYSDLWVFHHYLTETVTTPSRCKASALKEKTIGSFPLCNESLPTSSCASLANTDCQHHLLHTRSRPVTQYAAPPQGYPLEPTDSAPTSYQRYTITVLYLFVVLVALILLTVRVSQLESYVQLVHPWGLPEQSPIRRDQLFRLKEYRRSNDDPGINGPIRPPSLPHFDDELPGLLSTSTVAPPFLHSLFFYSTHFRRTSLVTAMGRLSINSEILVLVSFLLSFLIALREVTKRSFLTSILKNHIAVHICFPAQPTIIGISTMGKQSTSLHTELDLTSNSAASIADTFSDATQESQEALKKDVGDVERETTDATENITVPSRVGEEPQLEFPTDDSQESILPLNNSVVIPIDIDDDFFKNRSFVEIAEDDHIITTDADGVSLIHTTDDFDTPRLVNALYPMHNYTGDIVSVPKDIAYIPDGSAIGDALEENLSRPLDSPPASRPTLQRLPLLDSTVKRPESTTYLLPKSFIWTPRQPC